MPDRRRSLLGLAALLTILVGGCVRESVDSAGAVYTIEPRWIVFASIGAWGAAILGWMARKSRRDLGLALMIGGALILLTTVPGLVASWVRVSDDGVEWRRGLVARAYRFEDMEQIAFRPIASRVVQGGDPDVALAIRFKSRETLVLIGDRSNPLIRASAGEIVRRAKLRGVAINPKGHPAELPMIDE